MLIPKYWAQYKQRFDLSETADDTSDTFNSKQATIKRYGWSDVSQTEALSHAKSRVNEAHHRWLTGEDILRRERREEYNASNGIPIREEIISEHGFSENGLIEGNLENRLSDTQLIVTRNSYGAKVANVDNIAIIDVDNKDLLGHLYPEHYSPNGFMPAIPTYQSKPSSKLKVWVFILVFILIASVIAWLGLSWLWLLAVMFGVTAYLWQQASQRDKAHAQKYTDDIASLLPYMMDVIKKRVVNHPTERFRLYQTPAGFRIIATHDTISPSDELVAEWFEYFHADANYVRLCQAQQCFRARLTAKPWRMGEVENNKLAKDIPAKNFWFGSDNTDVENSIEQRQDELKARKQWIVYYDRFAQGYRACRYIESFAGKEASHQLESVAIKAFVEWHDRACRVDKDIEVA
ncbi:hypothetical protein GCM10016272_24880 [Psychrobacter glaciei]|uniref:Uncharacterized protein n=1 Tax=Psychrobacter glaciei TaxID=619771 RepID=A0ABQ3GTT8_9GAMM|nr:hypothetical protein [Psychrobacter glaciei]GHD37104.1 hypothetical protein GCM10016272_24880 [Psychrobacter glaciei]